MKAIFASLLILVLAGCSKSSNNNSTPPPQPQANQTGTADGQRCANLTEGARAYTYCVLDTGKNLVPGKIPAGQTLNIVYYWHGLDGSPQEIYDLDFLSRLPSGWQGHNMAIISLSAGTEGVISDDATNVVTDLLPAIETAVVPAGLVVNRIMTGASMGGHNSLRVVAEDPTLFRAVGALCPALVNIDIYDPVQLQAYETRNKAHLDMAFFQRVLNVFHTNFPEQDEWNRNNPFVFLAEGKFNSEQIFLSVGSEDSLGFYEGVTAFQQNFTGPAAQLEVAFVPGPHCVFNPIKFAQFIGRNLQ